MSFNNLESDLLLISKNTGNNRGQDDVQVNRSTGVETLIMKNLIIKSQYLEANEANLY